MYPLCPWNGPEGYGINNTKKIKTMFTHKKEFAVSMQCVSAKERKDIIRYLDTNV
jgi:hypothetical protein